jgi:hypothetical protein
MEPGGEPTLGDILAAAFAAARPAPSAARLEYDAAQLFAGIVADHYDLEWGEVWGVLCSVHDDDLGALKTASGWTALAAHIAKTLGASGDPLLAMVH